MECAFAAGPSLPTMARLLWTVALLGAFQSVVSRPYGLDKRWEELKVKHEWIDAPEGWVEVGQPPVDYPLKMDIGLKKERFGELLEHLYEVSDPEHHRYAIMFASPVRCSLTRLERTDTETTFRKRKSTNSSLQVPRPSNLLRLG